MAEAGAPRKRRLMWKTQKLLLFFVILAVHVVTVAKFNSWLDNINRLESYVSSTGVATTNFSLYNTADTKQQQMKDGLEQSYIRIPSRRMKLHYEERRNVTANNLAAVPGRLVYRGVSGLGHRILRMSAAFHVAKVMNLTQLWASWGWECGLNENGDPDIFDHLFGFGPMLVEPFPAGKVSLWKTRYNSSMPEKYADGLTDDFRIANEVPGYVLKSGCDRPAVDLVREKAISDVEFYRQLRALFRFNDRAEAFVEKHHFSERIVLGLHVRHGNGEKGLHKTRGIKNLDSVLANAAKSVYALTNKIHSAHNKKTMQKKKMSPLVFLATDSPAVLDKLANAMRPYNISVVTFPQRRMKEGTGISVGHKWDSNDACRESWVSQFMDATILSAADVVIAAQYSSFSQAVPLMTVLSELVVRPVSTQQISSANSQSNDDRFAHRLFCEVSGDGDAMRCFDDYLDWIFMKNAVTLGDNKSFQRDAMKLLYKKEVRVACVS